MQTSLSSLNGTKLLGIRSEALSAAELNKGLCCCLRFDLKNVSTVMWRMSSVVTRLISPSWNLVLDLQFNDVPMSSSLLCRKRWALAQELKSNQVIAPQQTGTSNVIMNLSVIKSPFWNSSHFFHLHVLKKKRSYMRHVSSLFSFCTFSLFSSLSEEESGFLGGRQGGQSIWAGRHSIPIRHQTRPNVRCVRDTEEATVLSLWNKSTADHLKTRSVLVK